MTTIREMLADQAWGGSTEDDITDDDVVIGAMVVVLVLDPNTGTERYQLAASEGLSLITQHGLVSLLHDHYRSMQWRLGD